MLWVPFGRITGYRNGMLKRLCTAGAMAREVAREV